jgi:tRNA (guanine-N7-)-methyltransferase
MYFHLKKWISPSLILTITDSIKRFNFPIRYHHIRIGINMPTAPRHHRGEHHQEMGQKKLKRFAEIATFPNVLQYPKDMAGKWHEHFGNDHPITLELACGKGEYAVGLARLHPERNFMGLDLKGNRIWVGARQALENGLQNVAFLRTQIDKITDYFRPGEVSEIWITFPDPQLRASRSKKRLTHPAFLRRYQQILGTGGYIHLKTDSPDLYIFTKEVIRRYGLDILSDIDDVHGRENTEEVLKIRTHYESLDISGSHRIYYLRFRLIGEILSGLDQELLEWVKNEPIRATPQWQRHHEEAADQ